MKQKFPPLKGKNHIKQLYLALLFWMTTFSEIFWSNFLNNAFSKFTYLLFLTILYPIVIHRKIFFDFLNYKRSKWLRLVNTFTTFRQERVLQRFFFHNYFIFTLIKAGCFLFSWLQKLEKGYHVISDTITNVS